MVGTPLSDVEITAHGMAILGYIVIALGILAPKCLASTIRRRQYGWSATALASVVIINLCVFTALTPTRPQVPFDEAFAGAFLSFCLSLFRCQRSKAVGTSTAAPDESAG